MRRTIKTRSIAFFLTPLLSAFLVQCSSEAEVIDLGELAESSRSQFVKQCPKTQYPEPITTSEGSVDLRETLEELNLEVVCGNHALGTRMDSLDAQKAEALNKIESDARRKASSCIGLSEANNQYGYSEREDCELEVELEAANKRVTLDRSLRPTEFEEFGFVCDSLRQLVSLADKYPDSIKPDSLADILSGRETLDVCER